MLSGRHPLGLGFGLFKQRSTKEYLTRKLKSSSEVCEGYVILDSYAILCESKTSSSKNDCRDAIAL